ncbi:uncharacterized protein [Littorina saxatilis]|uniref:uncharacterized protein isoform X2 n=1 Tax=Littorina saxatilis TaxID=31220 RepID=UPI0038B47B7E
MIRMVNVPVAKTFGHPDGPNNVVNVTHFRRGRWRCQDVTENEPETTATTEERQTPPQNRRSDDEGCGQMRPPGLTTQRSAEVDGPSARDKGKGKKTTDTTAKQTDETENNPTTSDHDRNTNTNEDNEDFPISLNSNTNASPRRHTAKKNTSSRITEQQISDTDGDAEKEEDGLSRTEILVVVFVVCVVLLSCLLPLWSASLDSWNILHVLWRLVFQGILVAFSVCLVILGLQVQFSSYHLRRWIARVFQLELKDEGAQSRLDQKPQETVSYKTSDTQLGDGDKEANYHLSREQRARNEPRTPTTEATRTEATRIEANIEETRDTVTSEAARDIANQKKEHVSIEEQVSQKANETKEETTANTEKCVQVTNQDKRHKNALKKMYRKFLQIRRKYKSEMWSLKRTDQEANAVLSRVQLALPALEKEKQALLAELEAIHKQHQEERRRNQDLIARLQRLNQQFMRVGTPQVLSFTEVAGSQSYEANITSTVGQLQEHQHQHNDPHHQQQPPHYNHHQQKQQQQQQQQSRLPTTGQKEADVKTEACHRGNNIWGNPAPYSNGLGQHSSSAQNTSRPLSQQQKQ